MVLTKNQISENLFKKLDLTKCDSKEFVNFFFEEVSKSLERGENVKLSGFGNFILKDKKSRPGRNPRTGKIILIPSRRVVVFKAGQKLKNTIKFSSSKIKH
ncbi:integration host factor subunit alpha [Buchnera aphidicola (Melanaphis sacchari)]|uniref:Integration host factor subunit alpha n=1 Tax=Buchnera aphidicola (Melanaphis sacchari) TaxID=2173854 RepID=A0A2U8DHE1_9GAMM|nr:integration host factor subunit alpha [Buchnera aphidicola]AWH90634.1 integration host factor subunit alpha [Buchnera aphidicola (Melanaphis sacchari)]